MNKIERRAAIVLAKNRPRVKNNMNASIQRILSVEKHSNADSLDVVQALGYKCIVKRDSWRAGDLCVFVEPDSVLPDKPWAAFYKARSSRVKAIKLRGVFSFGVIESIKNVGYDGPVTEGLDISEAIGVTHYSPPEPEDLQAAGYYPFGIGKTDEPRVQSIIGTQDMPPWGTLVDISQKIDGSSISFVYHIKDDVETRLTGGRSLIYKPDSWNNYTQNQANYDVLNKLSVFCRKHKVNLCLRGESYGNGIQRGAHNPHSSLPLSLALFSTYLIDENKYARKGHPFYIFDIAQELRLPTVPLLEKDVPLTPELIHKYDEGISEINGKPFEGVVINWAYGSFKVLSKPYDSLK